MKSIKSAAKKETPVDPKATALVSIRLRKDQLEKLDQIAEEMGGVGRSAAIKVAVAELIERRGK